MVKIKGCIIICCREDGLQLIEDGEDWDIQDNVIYGLLGQSLWPRFKFWLLKKILRKEIAFCKGGQ